MIKITQYQHDLITTHALSAYPNECCGFLTDSSFIALANIAENPGNSFKVSAVDYVRYRDNITAVVHTHIPPRRVVAFDVRTPSYDDIVGQRESGLPWLIFACDGSGISDPLQLPRVPNRDYLNRPFIWYINDCYSIVQDYYRFELDIILPDHTANADYTDVSQMHDLFAEHIQSYGFKCYDTLDGLKNGDLLLLDNGGFKRNHLGIVHNGQVLHQSMLSQLQPFSDFVGRINQVLKYQPD